MAKASKYEAKIPNENGYIHYTEDEDAIWHELITRQVDIIQNRACDEYLSGLEKLNLPLDRVPQSTDVSKVLYKHTGWQVEPVPALINFDRFFRLLADRKFPAAAFIRTREEMDYLQEPDIFHEIFGHCPLLTHPAFAAFTQKYGEYGLKASKQDRVLLARLYWFTVEFGLVNTAKGLRIYGGGITSSPGETVYALESDVPQRKPLDIIDVFRTPYRIDIYQTVYFILNKLDDLFDIANQDLIALIQQARMLGEHEPTFPPKEKQTKQQLAY